MGARTSFWSMLNDGRSIEIPALQRDYAHGRTGDSPEGKVATQVRLAFLATIDDVLTGPANDELCLDFMFGPQTVNRFLPIDGQQRLTTLFLYHWYLLPKSEDPSRLHRFQYYTRETSNAFCRLLAETPRFTLEPLKGNPSGAITNLGSFFLRWKSDPTVQGMLHVLDKIHERWMNKDDNAHTKAWKRLTDDKDPAIYFFIPNHNIGDEEELSPIGPTVDRGAADLYIRLNARGKPLTPFEQFKAWLEEYVENPAGSSTPLKVSQWEGVGRDEFPKSWKALLDSEWADVFWEHDDGNQIVDEEFLRFFTTVAVCDFALNNTFSNQETEEPENLTLRSIAPEQDSDTYVPTHLFAKHQVFNDRNLNLAFNVLDALAVDGEAHLREAFADLGRWPKAVAGDRQPVLLENIVTPDSVTYNARVRFYAVARFIAPRHTSIREKDQTTLQEVARFSRIVDNLVDNLQTEREEEFQTRIKQFDRLLKVIEEKRGTSSKSAGVSIYETVAGLSKPAIKEISGEQDDRLQDQLTEEVDKCRLILKDADSESSSWEEAIIEAETKAFTRGRIAFLLDYACTAVEKQAEQKDKLRRYASLIDQLFHENRTFYDSYENENTPHPVEDFRSTFLLRRALLTKGYFGFPTGRNWSFCGNRNDARAERRQWYSQGFTVSSGDEARLMNLLLEDLSERVGDRSITAKNVRRALHTIVKNYSAGHKHPKDWRWWFITYPKLLEYSDYNETSWIENRGEEEAMTYVLKLRQLNGRHVEMVSFCFYREILSACPTVERDTQAKDRTAMFPPFRHFDYYAPSNSSEAPCMYLDLYGPEDEPHGPHYALDISFDGSSHNALTGDMVLNFFVRDGDQQIPKKLEKALTSAGFQPVKGEISRSFEHRVRIDPKNWLSATRKAIEDSCGKLGKHLG